MNLYDLLSTPQLCELILLSAYPTSSDPDTWVKIEWPNYKPIMSVVSISKVTSQGGLIECSIPFVVTEGEYTVLCWALLLGNLPVLIGNLDPTQTVKAKQGGNLLQTKTIVFPNTFSL